MPENLFKSLVAVLTFLSLTFAGQFEEGDWVTYKDCGYIFSIDKGRNYLYFAASGGIMRYDFFRLKWDFPLTVAELPGEYAVFDAVYCVAYDQNTGILWCGTDKGFFAYQSMSRNWDKYELPVGDPTAFSIGLTQDNVWIAGGETYGAGVRTYFKGSPTFGNFQTVPASEIPDNVVWRGEKAELPEEFPVYFIKGEPGMIFDQQGILKDRFLKDYPVLSMLNDGRGNVWLGFAGYGLGQADAISRRMQLRIAGPESTYIGVFAIDGEDIWTGGRGLSYWKRDLDEWERFRVEEYTDFNSGRINDIYLNGNRIYLATDQGLTIYSRNTGRFVTYETFDNLWDSQVYSLEADGGRLWIGTAEGINYLDFDDNHIERVQYIENRRILTMKADGPFLWIGSEYGLHLYDKEKDRWTYVSGSPEMLDSEVWEIRVNGNEVWLARGKGIEMFDKKTGSWHPYQAVLYGEHRALSTLPTDSIVWVGTEGGLVKFDRDLNRWVTFTTEDGLPHNRVEQIEIEGDYLWLGTPGGLCRFYWNDPYRLD